MTDLVLILFLMTLLYMAIANRMRSFVKILALQGVLLFLVALMQLKEYTGIGLAWILTETIVFKSIAVPCVLFRTIRRNKITREAEPSLPQFVSLLIATLIIAGSVLMAGTVDDAHLGKTFFVAALSAIFFGLYFIATLRKLLSHVMGYMVIENGVTVLALAVGNEMPLLINLGVMLDIFASVLILGIFINKIGDVFRDADIGELTELRD
ncbi:MAG: hypothetical protein J6V65_04340 [Fibrobacterales bacterium]|nr:hypothetical protein [Fibrobacterales bacterium]MBO7501318.1 hypothetical protein [Fibrobacterales bacterium]